MTKSKEETNAEILSSAKQADVVTPESSSVITKRHVNSTHPIQCRCLLHREIRFHDFSAKDEQQKKSDLDWYQGD